MTNTGGSSTKVAAPASPSVDASLRPEAAVESLLRGLRIAGPVFRLMGRYRAATVVSLILAVGWFVLGLGSGAARAQSVSHSDDLVAPDLGSALGAPGEPGPVFADFGALGDSIRDAFAVIALGAFALAFLVFAASALVSVHHRRSVRLRAFSPVPLRHHAHVRPGGPLPGRSARHLLQEVSPRG